MLKIPQKIEYVIKTICENGYEAYIVGGCVRDMLLGKTPFDYDITTSATPEEIMSIFPKTVPTGIKHGTVSVIIDKECIEVTTFRTEGTYSDQRHPDSVSFVRNLNEDLSRRDFTVNAMAYSPETGLVDYFDGQADLNKKILRTVGDPEKRFSEDALRILRLFRFASVLNFEIEKNTLNSAIKLLSNLESISRERILNELSKGVSGENIIAMKPLTDAKGLQFLKITESPDYNLLNKLNFSQNLSLFSFLYLSGADVINTLNLLKASNKTKNYCNCLLKLLQKNIPINKAELKERLCEFDYGIICDYFKFIEVTKAIDTSSQKILLSDIIQNNEPYKISHLAINGDDISALGINGKKTGKILKRIQKKVIFNPELNNKSYLIELIKSM